MLRPRLIPCLLLHDEALVKTTRFGKFNYIGDPANTCRIFNELEVDELCLLDISASRSGREPAFDLLREIGSECFMPISYGGGVSSVDVAERILKLGFEKLVINTAALCQPSLITCIAREFGSQSLIVSIDVKTRWGHQSCWGRSAQLDSHKSPIQWARQVTDAGAGEILLTSIDREGTWRGLDVPLTRAVASEVSIPVIAHGGAGNMAHVADCLTHGGASAVAVGSMVVYQKLGMGVLINFPETECVTSRS